MELALDRVQRRAVVLAVLTHRNLLSQYQVISYLFRLLVIVILVNCEVSYYWLMKRYPTSYGLTIMEL
jgi:hypothetical protein